MATMAEIMQGLTILSKHVNAEREFLCAEHDEIYSHGPPPDELPEDEFQKLDELGFSWDRENESWRVFT